LILDRLNCHSEAIMWAGSTIYQAWHSTANMSFKPFSGHSRLFDLNRLWTSLHSTTLVAVGKCSLRPHHPLINQFGLTNAFHAIIDFPAKSMKNQMPTGVCGHFLHHCNWLAHHTVLKYKNVSKPLKNPSGLSNRSIFYVDFDKLSEETQAKRKQVAFRSTE